jgi:hypothetical protein
VRHEPLYFINKSRPERQRGVFELKNIGHMNIYVDTPFEQSQKDKLRLKVPDGHLHFKDEIPSSEAQLAALMNAEIVLAP